MNIAKLRSRLVLASPDLQTLTSTDLESCLWSTKQRLVLALFQETSLLEEEYNKLSELIEGKSAMLANWRRTNTAKEVKQQYEHQFRSNFLRVLLSGLEKVRWPPTLEAFSNPLPALSDDKSYFLEAIDYIVSVIHPHIATPRIDRPPSTSSRSAPPSSGNQRPLETHFGSFEVSKTPPPQLLPSPRTHALPQPPAEPALAAAMEANDSLLSPPRRPTSEPDSRPGKREAAPDACILAVLQMQNDQLRTRLARAEEAILRRDQAEQTVGLLIRDFLSATSELASAGEGAEDDNESTRGAAATPPAAGRALRTTMRRLHASLTQLDRQWREARTSARRAATEARAPPAPSPAASRAVSRLARLSLSAPEVAHSDRASTEAFSLQRDLVRWADAALRLLDDYDDGMDMSGRGGEALADLATAARDVSLRLARGAAVTDEDAARPALARLAQAVEALPRSSATAALRDEVDEVRRGQAALWRDRLRARRQLARQVQLARRLAGLVDDVCGRWPALVGEVREQVERRMRSGDGGGGGGAPSLAETFRALEDAVARAVGPLRATASDLRRAAEDAERGARDDGSVREEAAASARPPPVAGQAARGKNKSPETRTATRRTAAPLASRPPFDLSLS